MNKRIIFILSLCAEYIRDRVLEDYGFTKTYQELEQEKEFPQLYYNCINLLHDMGVDDYDNRCIICGNKQDLIQDQGFYYCQEHIKDPIL